MEKRVPGCLPGGVKAPLVLKRGLQQKKFNPRMRGPESSLGAPFVSPLVSPQRDKSVTPPRPGTCYLPWLSLGTLGRVGGWPRGLGRLHFSSCRLASQPEKCCGEAEGPGHSPCAHSRRASHSGHKHGLSLQHPSLACCPTSLHTRTRGESEAPSRPCQFPGTPGSFQAARKKG